ncbi:MAG: type II toxin-antitoxin system RelE/ParE family toxin [Methanothrix sp.]|nr:type II toxin-antitoxin system RelE/ParE family toxin [Methanothrix sp.]
MDYESTLDFDANFLKLTSKNKALEVRLLKKIGQILNNPSIGTPKRYKLKHARGSHVNPYVIVYRIKGDRVQFLYVDHHDLVYEKSAEILEEIEREEDQIPN